MKKRNRFKGVLLFLWEIISKPRLMGTLFPSSRWLARALAIEARKYGGTILELGAGTGTVTKALLAQGISGENIIAMERSDALSKHLMQRFPTIRIINGDASHMDKLLGEDFQKITTIVSGLPLRSLPNDVTRAIVEQFEKLLKNQAKLIQFTYSLRKNTPHFSKHLVLIKSKRVWRNFPPARIDIFEYCD